MAASVINLWSLTKQKLEPSSWLGIWAWDRNLTDVEFNRSLLHWVAVTVFLMERDFGKKEKGFIVGLLLLILLSCSCSSNLDGGFMIGRVTDSSATVSIRPLEDHEVPF